MEATRSTDSGTDWSARVVVRVPRTGDGDLAGSASRRLARADGVDDVAVVELRGLEPALAATNAHVEVTIVVDEGLRSDDLEDRLCDAPGVERVEDLDPA